MQAAQKKDSLHCIPGSSNFGSPSYPNVGDYAGTGIFVHCAPSCKPPSCIKQARISEYTFVVSTASFRSCHYTNSVFALQEKVHSLCTKSLEIEGVWKSSLAMPAK